uniref:Carbonic anhydrase n=1 Tax=Archivesica packardana TaxID=1299447 RepID=A0A5P8D3H3_9BIVA|nr:carbonic anhydrase [Archivesica packardana]
MDTWGYTQSNGPTTWVKNFPIAAGKKQSPIDIVTSNANYDSELCDNPLRTDYNPEAELNLVNNGHSIMCQIKAKSELTGGPLDAVYRLEQFHLHWGSSDDKGSEHTIDGNQYPAELHLVHWNTNKYKSFSEAVDKDDGLAVLGIMIKVGFENQTFKCLTDNVSYLTSRGSKYTADTCIDPTLLLPGNTSQYWTYDGSLTTPPLYESVKWIVFKEPVEYSKNQFAILRSMSDSDGQHMQDNFRPPLKIYQRTVKASFP